jgi:hypothetical protein
MIVVLKKIIISVSLVMLLLVGGVSATTLVSNDVSVYVDNVKVSFPDQKPYIDKNSRTLVPIRFIAEEMGAEVGWDGKINLVTIQKEDTEIKLTIGEQTAIVNGKEKKFDTSAVLNNGRTMVPLRFISEALGAEVGWDGSLNRVDIWTKEGPGKVEEPKNPKAPAVTPYTGAKTIDPKEWKSASGTAEVFRWENPVIKYITMADLPAELNNHSILNIKVDDKYVNVTLWHKTGYQSAPRMFLAEGTDITRIRTYKNITPIDGYSYIQKYDIKHIYDTDKDMGNLPTECDIKKVTHFIFQGYASGSDQDRLLAVENPLYKEAK